MKIVPISYKDATRQRSIFFSFFQKEPPLKEELFSHMPEAVKKPAVIFAKKYFHGGETETKSLWLPRKELSRLVFFGWGERSKWNYRKTPLVARRFVHYAKTERVTEFVVPFTHSMGVSKQEGATIFAINALLAHFEFTKYKTKPKDGWPEVKIIYLAADKKDHPELNKGIREGLIIGEEANACRDLANTPGGDMTPTKLAEAAVAAAKRTGIKVKILGEKEMKRLGMGGVLGVARGSDEKPRFIILEYQRGPRKPVPSGRGSPHKVGRQKPLVLVGKGITFDSGGLNLKSRQGIYEMHMDMSGGAAVIHGMAAIARLKMPIHVIGLVPAAENMPSGSSYHPGDLLKTLSGKTIEVLDTDAEGRVLLSDALAYGVRQKPGLMVDFATLTGAAHVALGDFCSAVLSNNERLHPQLIEIGKRSGDYVWPLPLWDEYFHSIKGTFGDVANLGKEGSTGDAIHGAKFLEQFVGKTPWAHIDIAPRMTTIEGEHLAKGASGVGVRYIVELAKNYPGIMNREL